MAVASGAVGVGVAAAGVSTSLRRGCCSASSAVFSWTGLSRRSGGAGTSAWRRGLLGWERPQQQQQQQQRPWRAPPGLGLGSGSRFTFAAAASSPAKVAPRGPPKGGKAARRAFSKERQEERLAKVLAAAGVASRRASEEIIFAGRVTVNGSVVTLPQTMVDARKDSIYVDGRSLPKREPDRLHFCLNKPKGFICTSSTKEGGSKRVVDLFDEWLDVWMEKHPGGMRPRLFTVGRLDVQTTGLLLVTNDGDWAQEVMHPSSGVTKEYIATTDVPPTRRQLATIEQGCEIDGAFVKPVYVGLVEQDPRSSSRVVIEVADGRNREVRRLIENAGLQAVKLKRTRVGGLRLSRKLLPGQFTAMHSHEVKQVLNKAAQSSFATTIVPH